MASIVFRQQRQFDREKKGLETLHQHREEQHQMQERHLANLMNISTRSVESSRYRLRKRMGLGSEVNLTEFLIRF